MIRWAVVLIAVAACLPTTAQRKTAGMQMAKTAPTVCYGSGKNEFTTVGLSAEYLAYKASKSSSRTQSASIEVAYEGFTPEAQAAFQQAVDIWESILQTPVKIRVHARWIPLETGVLGSASPSTYVYDFDNAPMKEVWYPIALAEKIAGKDLNDPTEYDIEASFNSAQTLWHFGLTGSNPPAGKYDLLSIVLHEIGHGLGITHAYDIQDINGVIPGYFLSRPVVYETNIQTGGGANLVYDFQLNTTTLKSAITSRSLFYVSNLVQNANSGANATLYAPAAYVGGSSIAHLDEITYPAGNINSLMTPAIGMAERILDPGPIIKNILKEMGWTITAIDHSPLKDTENTAGPYHAVAKVRSDNGYVQTNVKLVYLASSQTHELSMMPTGNPDEYAADIPGGSSLYGYQITVTDNDNRVFTIPSSVVAPGSHPATSRFSFNAGPDNVKPVVTHTSKEFITNIDDLVIDANVTDNIGIDTVTLQWKLNSVVMPEIGLAALPGSKSTYETIISKNIFQIGDILEYRIRAVDSSVAGNVNYYPSVTDFIKVTVAGFGETRDSYLNDFNNFSAADFFGSGFTVQGSQIFNGCIHTTPAPYPAGGAAGAHVDFIYNLKYPIRVAAEEATVKFDEIVLVEPGEDGAVWPNEDFYDYVVVEGSQDGGVTWLAIADGYDCNYNSVWKDLWNSTVNGQNSTGVPTPAMYRSHVFNLLNKFHAGDEVALRFRLYSDPFATGDGWTIDNLKIQIDETPPSIRHQHYDYVMDGTSAITLYMKIRDFHGLDHVFVDYKVNNGTTTSGELIINPASDMYSSTIDLSALGVKAGDDFQYRIRAIDPAGNVGTFPSDGFITTAVISLTSPLDQIVANFSAVSPDLTGNFFSLTTNNGNGTMSTNHPYSVGLDAHGISDFTFMTKKAVKVNPLNPRIYYTDIALVEYDGAGVKDYVVVEASNDGLTWQQLISPYAANALSDWKTIYDVNGSPTAQDKLQPHQFDITAGGNFKAGDVILVRFRLHSDSLKSGWGWSVDDVNIQGAVTGLEPQIANEIVATWPNPVTGGSLYLKTTLPTASDVSVEIFNMHGQTLSRDQFSAPPGDSQREYDVSTWSGGVYLVKVKSVLGTSITKLIKLR